LPKLSRLTHFIFQRPYIFINKPLRHYPEMT
jgi:hypothetical protein